MPLTQRKVFDSMITDMRKGLKTYGVKAVLWLVIISMVLGYAVFRNEDSAQRSFLRINGRDISRSYFEQKFYQENQRIQNLRERLGADQADIYLNMLGLSNPKIVAFNDIIRQTVLDQVAKKMGMSVSEEFIIDKLQNPSFMIANLIDEVPVFVFDPISGRINQEKLNQYLRYTGKTMLEFEENIENIFKRVVVNHLAELSSYILPEEVVAYYNENYTAKKFEVLTFSLDTFKKSLAKEAISSQELQNYFEQQNQRQKRYFLPEKRTGVAYIFSPENYTNAPKSADIAAYYAAHKTSFVKKPAQAQLRRIVFNVAPDATPEQIAQVQEQAQKVLEEIKTNPTPTQFEALARKYSQDSQTASLGGLMPAFSRGQLDPALEEAFFKLRKDGDVSDLVASKQGIEILQRVLRTPAIYKTLEEAADDIARLIRTQEFKKHFAQDAAKAIRQARSNPAAIKDLIQKKQAKEEKIDHIQKDQSLKADKLFKMRQGDWGYYFDGNNGIVIQVQEVHKSQPPAFEAAQNHVKSDFIHAKAKNELKKVAQQAEQDALQKALKDLVGNAEAKFDTIDFVARTDKSRVEQLQKQEFPIGAMLQLTKPGSVKLILEDQRAYLVKCIEAQPINQELFQKEKRSIVKTLYKEQKPLIEGGFVASLFRNATINSIDPELNIKQ